MKRKAIANDTLKIMEAGYYNNSSGDQISISLALQQCMKRTHLVQPEQFETFLENTLAKAPRFPNTTFVVENETTLVGGKKMTDLYPEKRIGVLNFASAKNAGGGFLKGAHAQEESLARSSGLYKSLLKCGDYYRDHRILKTALYSDRMIYAPQCPVFRKDNGDLLDQPYLVDFLTSPAPNAGAMKQNEKNRSQDLEPTLYQRGKYILTLFAQKKCDHLILGAWGCGVFQNDPQMVAEMFHSYLKPGALFHGRFESVCFSVFDNSSEQIFITPFLKRFQ